MNGHHPSAAAGILAVLGILLAALGGPAWVWAQLPVLDPLPTYARADTSSGSLLVFHYDRYADGNTNWTTSRLGLTLILPTSARNYFFLRSHFLAFDSGRRGILQRWPQLAEEAPAGWPQEQNAVGWTRPEIGLLIRQSLPGSGTTDLDLALALPMGRDELYPMTAASMPLRMFLGKCLDLSASWRLRMVAGYILHLDSGREWLKAEAFPSGPVYEVECQWWQGARRSAALFLHEELYGERRSTRLGCQAWLPYADRHALGLSWQLELGGKADRPFATLLSLSWRLRPPVLSGPQERPR